MHLIIAHAAAHAPACRAALPALQLPHLQRLLARLWHERVDAAPDPADSRSPAHERALAQALGWPQADGAWPWAAWQVHSTQGQAGAQAWAWVTPCHWRMGQHSLTLEDPQTLALNHASSAALHAALAPWFASAGLELLPDAGDASGAGGAPGRWLAQGELLRGLRTTALDCAIGRSVQTRDMDGPHAAALRRLQSEMQMLLYTHPINDARVAGGLLPVNSLWFSGAGALSDAQQAQAARSADSSAPVVLDDLRASALQGDASAWVQAWQHIDSTHLALLCQRLEQQGATEPLRLTLCSLHQARTYQAGASAQTPTRAVQRWWARMSRRWARQPSVPDALTSLISV